MLDCFEDMIGIRNGCGLTAPRSNYFINDLSGISLKIADAASDSETQSGVALLQEKIGFASEVLMQDMRTFLLPKMRANTVVDNDTAGKFKENLEVINLQAGQYKGILIDIREHDYLSFYLNSVRLKLTQSIATNVLVIDLMRGAIRDTFPITTVAGQATEIFTQTSYPVYQQRLQLLICIDSGVSNSYDTSLNVGCDSCGRGSYSNRMVDFSSVQIAQADPLINSNTSSINNTNGISINYSVRCDVQPFVCNMAHALAYPLLYKSGSLIMEELLFSKRLNSIVNIHGADNSALRDMYEQTYQDSMNRIMDNLAIPDDLCFECKRQVRHVESIP